MGQADPKWDLLQTVRVLGSAAAKADEGAIALLLEDG